MEEDKAKRTKLKRYIRVKSLCLKTGLTYEGLAKELRVRGFKCCGKTLAKYRAYQHLHRYTIKAIEDGLTKIEEEGK